MFDLFIDALKTFFQYFLDGLLAIGQTLLEVVLDLLPTDFTGPATTASGYVGWLIAAVLALGALGDVLLDAIGLEKGAIAFALGHMLAIWLYANAAWCSLLFLKLINQGHHLYACHMTRGQP